MQMNVTWILVGGKPTPRFLPPHPELQRCYVQLALCWKNFQVSCCVFPWLSYFYHTHNTSDTLVTKYGVGGTSSNTLWHQLGILPFNSILKVVPFSPRKLHGFGELYARNWGQRPFCIIFSYLTSTKWRLLLRGIRGLKESGKGMIWVALRFSII